MRQAYEACLRRHRGGCFNGTTRLGQQAAPERGRFVTEGRGAPKGAAKVREEPVAGIARENGATIVSLAGELDLYNAQTVRETLLKCCEEAPERLIVELSGVKFIDSTALGVLIEARSRMANRRAFKLAAPGLETRRALEISGLDRHFTVHDTVEDARSSDA
jgi:anti-sigma B factor antagonist